MEEKTISEELNILVRTNGPEVLSDSGKINGILADLFPKAEKERSAIRSALRAGAGRMFYELSVAPPAGQPAMLQNIKRKLSEEAWLSNQACDYVCTVFLRALGVTVAEPAGAAADNVKPGETEESGKAAEDKVRAEADSWKEVKERAVAREEAKLRKEAQAQAAEGKKDPNTGKNEQTGAWILFAIFAAIFYFWRIKGDNLIKYFELYIRWRSMGITDVTRWAPCAVAQGGCVAAGFLFSVIECVKPGKTVKWLILLATVGLIVASAAEAIVDPSVMIGENPDNISIAAGLLVLNIVPACLTWILYDSFK